MLAATLTVLAAAEAVVHLLRRRWPVGDVAVGDEGVARVSRRGNSEKAPPLG